MRIIVCAVIFLILPQFTFADGFELHRARIRISVGYRAKLGFKDKNNFPASLVIEEMNYQTLQTRITTIPVELRFYDRGVIAKVDDLSSDSWGKDSNGIPAYPVALQSYMKVMNLSGKIINSLFNNMFYGGEVSAALGFNLGESIHINSYGVVITDTQTILLFFRGLGLRVTYSEMVIVPSSTNTNVNVKVTVGSQTSEEKTVPLSDVINRQF